MEWVNYPAKRRAMGAPLCGQSWSRQYSVSKPVCSVKNALASYTWPAIFGQVNLAK